MGGNNVEKHTPNRWTVTHEMTGIGNRQVWGVVTTDTGEPVANCGTTGEGTARFIVHAVNCHADLIADLENARENMAEICGLLRDGLLDAAESWAEANEVDLDAEIRFAVAKARGE